MIEANKLVWSLKEAIKVIKKPELDDVPTDTLVCWKVSVSRADIHSLEKLSDAEFANDPPLLSIDTLSEVFSSDVPKKHIHVVIKVPTDCMCPRFKFLAIA